MTEPSLAGETLRRGDKSTTGLLLLFAFSSVQALLVGFALRVSTQWFSSAWLEFVVPMGVIIPALMMIGFAFTIPLLLFRSVAMRTLTGLLAATSLWGLLILGIYLSQVSRFDAEFCFELTSVMLLSLVGAVLPIGLVMSLFQWRIRGPGYQLPPAPIGIMDLIALTAWGAVVFGYQRLWGPFSDENISAEILMLIIAFYSMIGAVIAMSLLLAMRMMLGADQRPFRWPNLIGVILTVALVNGTWALPLLSNDWGQSMGIPPLLMWLLVSLITWLTAAATAFGVCWWLRRYRFQLTSAALERAFVSQPEVG